MIYVKHKNKFVEKQIDDIMIEFGKAISQKRKSRKLMGKELAEQLGIDPQLLSRFENGKRALTLRSMLMLAEKLDMKIEVKFN